MEEFGGMIELFHVLIVAVLHYYMCILKVAELYTKRMILLYTLIFKRKEKNTPDFVITSVSVSSIGNGASTLFTVLDLTFLFLSDS